MRVLSVVGCRPQFVKAAVVSRALDAAGVDEMLVHTGQHYDAGLSSSLLDELGVFPHVFLGQTLLDGMVEGLRGIVRSWPPDWVLVFGDTRSTLAGALAAGPVPVAHVEAGCRSWDWSMPEEHIRVTVDRLSSLLFCSSRAEELNCWREGLDGDTVATGDVMLDAVGMFAPEASTAGGVLLTIHREANIPRLREILSYVAMVGSSVLFPAHPRARAALDGWRVPGNVVVCPPFGYRDMLGHVRRAPCVITDSGGLQKEAYWLGTPCVTVRPSTEWTATVEAGANVLVEPSGIPDAVAAARFPVDAPQLYGDGHAAERVVEALLR